MNYYNQILVREGTFVEYLPGLFSPADLSDTPSQRAFLICPHLPDEATPTGLTALWIHTGWWPPSRVVRLYCARHKCPHQTVTSRWDLNDDSAMELAGYRVPTLARTAFDLLVTEEADIAIQGCLLLLRKGLSIDELRRQGWIENGRRKAPFARRMIEILADYLSETRLDPVTR